MNEIYGTCDRCGDSIVERCETTECYGHGENNLVTFSESVHTLELYETNDGFVCRSCLNELGLVLCDCCDTWVKTLNSESVCEKCERGDD